MTPPAVRDGMVELTLEGLDGKPKTYFFAKLTPGQQQRIRACVYQEVVDHIKVLVPDLDLTGLTTRQLVSLFGRPHTLFLRTRDASDIQRERLSKSEKTRLTRLSNWAAQFVYFALTLGHPGMSGEEISHVIEQIDQESIRLILH